MGLTVFHIAVRREEVKQLRELPSRQQKVVIDISVRPKQTIRHCISRRNCTNWGRIWSLAEIRFLPMA
jgi:hypothetical protein